MLTSIGLDINEISQEVRDIKKQHILSQEDYKQEESSELFHSHKQASKVEDVLEKYQKLHEERKNMSLKLSQIEYEQEAEAEQLSDASSEEGMEKPLPEEAELSREESYIRKKLSFLGPLPTNFTRCELITHKSTRTLDSIGRFCLLEQVDPNTNCCSQKTDFDFASFCEPLIGCCSD